MHANPGPGPSMQPVQKRRLLRCLFFNLVVFSCFDSARSATACSEEQFKECDSAAYCDADLAPNQCVCPEGLIGDGKGADSCKSEGYTVRLAYKLVEQGVNPPLYPVNWPDNWPGDLEPGSDFPEDGQVAGKLSGFSDMFGFRDFVGFEFGLTDIQKQNIHHETTFVGQYDDGQDNVCPDIACELWLTINILFEDKDDADAAVQLHSNDTSALCVAKGFLGGVNKDLNGVCPVVLKTYNWNAPTSGAPKQILPTGLSVLSVTFEPNCAAEGCWVIEVTYTTGGESGFNSFYIPQAIGSDALSRDPDYSQLVQDTFFANKFPCGSDKYDPTDPGDTAPPEVTSCCIPEFNSNYRPTQNFFDDTADAKVCPSNEPQIYQRLYSNHTYDIEFPKDNAYMIGKFKGLSDSPGVAFKGVIDPFLRVYEATIKLDEKELRTTSGMLSGTVGVDHSIDTFIGIANFRPTEHEVLDSAAYQTAIHLEKSSFFTVSSHGTNDYTFVQYVNLRLVSIYLQDTNFGETTAEFSDRTTRTSSDNAAHYLQITFTLGAQYIPNSNDEIIPIDSVLVGQGDFFEQATLFQACTAWQDDSFTDKGTISSRLSQTCAPNATMCENPSDIPDQFVVFNIPLGVQWLPDPSETLSENVFVSLVVSAVDDSVPANGQSDDAEQMKTTITASIPVVEGGVNIFCDGFVAKTDLKDVANADIILGSAGLQSEMARLTILKDIASTDLQSVTSSPIKTDSIESGLMTLVLRGTDEYFGNGGTSLYSLELEDVITVHIMEDPSCTDCAFTRVLALLQTAGDDNDGNPDGYKLNDAFEFRISRAQNRAYLEPTAELLGECPFNPTKPTTTNMFPTTCVTRRDVRYRGFPHRVGAWSTAMELSPETVPAAGRDREALYMQTVLGESDYADELGRNYSLLVAQQYSLDGMYKRAFWINPGYEWTPTQTGGTPTFTLSQKIVFFALINLNEGFAGSTPANEMPAVEYLPGDDRRRARTAGKRMMLSSTAETGAGMSSMAVQFETSPLTLIADSFNIPPEKVATFHVQLQLTVKEACMTDDKRLASLRDTLDDYLTLTASKLETVQVLSTQVVGLNGVQCTGATSRRLSSSSSVHSFSSAVADVVMLVAFSVEQESRINLEAISQLAGVNSVDPLRVSDSVVVDQSYLRDPKAEEDAAAQQEKGEGDNSLTVAIAAGIAGGVVFLLIGAVLLWRWWKSQNEHEEVVHAIQGISIEHLKQQVVDDL